ncbi:MAG: hypothetical protein KC438_12985, partial [Thermomicrobiales bacterium]|nr:hypothetical protein [Thermomicrobiales bacterium]
MSDREPDTAADDAAATNDAAPAAGKKTRSRKASSGAAPKRSRSRSAKAAETVQEEAADMVAEGGPVG